MALKVDLVPAVAGDVTLLAGFLGELFALEKDFEPDLGKQAAALTEILSRPEHAAVYTIRLGSEIIGMIALHHWISSSEGGWVGRIEDFYIKPEFRRRGFGRQAIEQIRAVAASRGLLRLTLAADKDNGPALAFYCACGFTEMNLVVLKHTG